MLLRVTIASAVLNPPLALALIPYLAAAFVVGAVVTLAAWRTNAPAGEIDTPDSPLRVAGALQMAALFQVVLFVTAAVQRRGSEALVATSALVGLTDLDALTLSLARQGEISDLQTTAVALVTGVLSNTLLKMAVAAFVGRGWFRAAAGGALGAMAVALGMMLLLR
jgi:uncharacterized membrane protein (DUF4010 family)